MARRILEQQAYAEGGGTNEASDASHDSRSRSGGAGFRRPGLAPRPARAAKQYGPGATDSEIKIGNTGPYSGPLSNASPIPFRWPPISR